jgi:uroporphyrinogen decarboxylase
MNKRDSMLSVLDRSKPQTYIPAAFFLHFDPDCHSGPKAVRKHLEFFQYTEMDFIKIQYEHVFPKLPMIQSPQDWKIMPEYKIDFYQSQLDVVEGLVKEAGKDALVILTLYSPFMCAGHTAGTNILDDHIRQDPDAVKKGMRKITDSLMKFVEVCIDLGVDGFYASTQGGESRRFSDKRLFLECVKPYDLEIMTLMNQSCKFNILHICDYHMGYEDLTLFLDYPGHVVNLNLQTEKKLWGAQEISSLFTRPYMGGLDRKGVIATGNPEEIVTEVQQVLTKRSERFILAADCTVPGNTPWENLRTAVRSAHQYIKA